MNWSFPLCPQSPDWTIDWPALEARFTWLAGLADTPQDPRYHAEGNVLIHTRMVVEELVALPAWRELDIISREDVFAAALLHDISKPECTVIEADGSITAHGHTRAGEHRARLLLWRCDGLDTPMPLVRRETVAALVRLHSLPIWALMESNTQRRVFAASQRVRLDHLALLSEADVRGRIGGSRNEFLERIELFRLYIAEQHCADRPRAFANDHSRFVYFQRSGRDPNYAAFDDTLFEVTLLAGLPAAGKDTWLAQHAADMPVVTLDAIRQELDISPRDEQGAVVRLAKGRARELLRQRTAFVWNATNITRAMRGPLIELFASYHARIRIVYLDAPRNLILARNRRRAEPVPEAVIERLMQRLEIPDPTEAQQVEWVDTRSAN